MLIVALHSTCDNILIVKLSMNVAPINIPGKFLSAYQQFQYCQSYRIKYSSTYLYAIFWAFSARITANPKYSKNTFMPSLNQFLTEKNLTPSLRDAVQALLRSNEIISFIQYVSTVEAEKAIIVALIQYIEHYTKENEKMLMENKYYCDYLKQKNMTTESLITNLKANKVVSLVYYILSILMDVKLIFRIWNTEHHYPKEEKEPMIYIIICDDIANILLTEEESILLSKYRPKNIELEDNLVPKICEPLDVKPECDQFFKDNFKPPTNARKVISSKDVIWSKIKKAPKLNNFTYDICENDANALSPKKHKNGIVQSVSTIDLVLSSNTFQPSTPCEKNRLLYPPVINLACPKSDDESCGKTSNGSRKEESTKSLLTPTSKHKAYKFKAKKPYILSPLVNPIKGNISRPKFYSTVSVDKIKPLEKKSEGKHYTNEEEKAMLADSFYITIRCSMCTQEIKEESQYISNGKIYICANCFQCHFKQIAQFDCHSNIVFNNGLTFRLIFPKIKNKLFAFITLILTNSVQLKCQFKKVLISLTDLLSTECPYCFLGWYAHKKLIYDKRLLNFICVMCHGLGTHEVKLSCSHYICYQCYANKKEYVCHFCSNYTVKATPLIDYTKYDYCSQCSQSNNLTHSCQNSHRMCYSCSILSYDFISQQHYCLVCKSACELHRLDNSQIIRVQQ